MRLESMNYTYFLNLAKEVEPPADGILSRTVFQNDRVKAIVLGRGREPPKTRRRDGDALFVKGEASVGQGDETQDAQAGT